VRKTHGLRELIRTSCASGTSIVAQIFLLHRMNPGALPINSQSRATSYYIKAAYPKAINEFKAKEEVALERRTTTEKVPQQYCEQEH